VTHFTFTVQAAVDGVTAPLQIHAESMNEVRHAVRLLKENDMLVENGNGNAPKCPIHHKPMKPSKKPGAWYCSARVGEGYCDQKVGGYP
jgi:hypothetical protein